MTWLVWCAAAWRRWDAWLGTVRPLPASIYRRIEQMATSIDQFFDAIPEADEDGAS